MARSVDMDAVLHRMREVGLEPLEAYPGAREPWKCKCLSCGEVVTPKWNHIQQGGGGCRACGYRRNAANLMSDPVVCEEFMLKAGMKPTTPFPGKREPWYGVCLTCGREISPRLSNVENGGGVCAYCARKKRDPEEAAESLARHGAEPLVPFPGAGKPWRSTCLKCHKEISPSLNSVEGGQGACLHCMPNPRVTAEEAVMSMLAADLQPLEPYPGNVSTPWKSICLSCGAISHPQCSSVRKGRRCGSCAPHGLNPDKPAVIYILFHDRMSAVKIGITGIGTSRLKQFQSRGWKVYTLHKFPTGLQAQEVEQRVLTHIRKDLKYPPYVTHEAMDGMTGWTETIGAELLPPEAVSDLVVRLRG